MSMPRPGAGEGDEDPEPAQLDTVYELDATAAWVRAGGYTRVALQMPDELLHDAVAVAAALVRRCNAGTEPSGTGVAVRAFVLADTTFGSCCVDEVAAAHHAADCIVHFGRACMSPVSRLPARFVFNKVHVDTAACAAAIREHAVALAAANIAATDEDRRVDALVVLVDQEHAHETSQLRRYIHAAMAAVCGGVDDSGGRGQPPRAAVPVVVADMMPVEALPRDRAHARGDARGASGGSSGCGCGRGGGGGGGGCGGGGGGGGCDDGTCSVCENVSGAEARQGGGAQASGHAQGSDGNETGETGRARAAGLHNDRRRMVERVTDNLAALSFHSGGGGGDAQDRDHDPCTKEGEGDDGEDGDVTRRDHAVVAARVEAAAAAADPALGAAYASHVAEGMRAAVSGSSSSSGSSVMRPPVATTLVADAAATAAAIVRARVAGQLFALPLGVKHRSTCAFVWVGNGDSPALTQALALLHGQCRGVAQFDPQTRQLCAEAAGTAQVSRVVKRRRYLIERARESRVVGIVAGTLGVAGYLTAIARLRALIAASGRKSYTVVAGKPNPQKLANFPEIEAFVLVACEQAALIDGRDYLQPVITPWEAEVAFTHGKHWDGEVRLNFEHLLEPGYDAGKDGEKASDVSGGAGINDVQTDRGGGIDAEAEADEVEFSFFGGGVRAAAAHRRTFDDDVDADVDADVDDDMDAGAGEDGGGRIYGSGG
jgi:diphthamide biosynthesis protein 2